MNSFNRYLSIQLNGRAMTDDVLEHLSRRLSKNDMKRLAPELNISPEEVNTRYANDCTDRAAVTAANHDILSDWLNRQDSREEAHILIGEALIRAGLKLIAREVLNYSPTRRKTSTHPASNTLATGTNAGLSVKP